MSDLTPVNPEVLDFTAQERQQINELCRKHTRISKVCIYLAWRSESYKDMVLETFGDFCDQYLEISRKTVYRWISQVQSTMHILNLPIEKFVSFDTTLQEVKLLPSSTTDELNKLPTPELQREAYEQMKSIRQDGAHSADYQQGVKIIVSQLLEANTLKQIPAPPTPVEPPARSPFSSPPSAERTPSAPTSAPSPAGSGRSYEPIPKAVPPRGKVTKQPVPSYRSSIDPEPYDEAFAPESPECPDAEEVEICLDTFLAWVKSGKIEDKARIRERTLAVICQAMEWAQAQP